MTYFEKEIRGPAGKLSTSQSPVHTLRLRDLDVLLPILLRCALLPLFDQLLDDLVDGSRVLLSVRSSD